MSELNEKRVKTRIVHKHDIPENWAKATGFIPKQGELIIYDDKLLKVDDDGKTVVDRVTADTVRYKIGDGITSVVDLPFASSSISTSIDGAITEEDVVLKTDLYAYTSVGKIYGSNTSPAKVASAGDSLKTVFTNVFGTQQDTQPSVSNSVSLTVSAPTVTAGGGECGTAVASTDVTITFTLNNTGTASYGYRCGDAKTTDYQTFYYPVTKQNNAHLKITLPSDKTASAAMVTAGTYVSHSNNVLYCDFSSSKTVSIKINLPASTVTTSSQTRYGQISASVKFGAAQKDNTLDVSNTITKFLTFMGNDATTSSYYTVTDKTCNTSSYTISSGSYPTFYMANTSTSLPETLTHSTAGVKKLTGSYASISLTSDSYIWFLLPPTYSGSKSIKYEALGQWYDFGGGTSDPTDVSVTLSNGATFTYKGYRTNKMASAGTTSFKIV